MKITYSALLAVNEALNILARAKMPLGAVAINLSRVAKLTAAYDEERVALLKELGKLDESGTKYEFESEEKKKEFGESLKAILETEVDFTPKQIPMSKIEPLLEKFPVDGQVLLVLIPTIITDDSPSEGA